MACGSQKKTDQLDLALKSIKARQILSDDLKEYRFEHNALPEIDFNEIDTSVKFLGKKLKLPLIISSITGGMNKGRKINKALAELANDFCVGFSVGSQRVAIEDEVLADTFRVRNYAPDILLFANLGAVQLNYGYGIEECQRVVDMIEADALFLHLNPLQEAFQPGASNVNFSGLLKKIEQICKKLDVPVFIKEVGSGISKSVAQKLKDAGVSGIDVAGCGNYSWANVEAERSNDVVLKASACEFLSWGMTAAECIKDISGSVKDLILIASGGISNGLEIAKFLALGANLCSAASPFLLKVNESRSECENFMESIIFSLKTAMFCTGSKNISELKKAKIKK